MSEGASKNLNASSFSKTGSDHLQFNRLLAGHRQPTETIVDGQARPHPASRSRVRRASPSQRPARQTSLTQVGLAWPPQGWLTLCIGCLHYWPGGEIVYVIRERAGCTVNSLAPQINPLVSIVIPLTTQLTPLCPNSIPLATGGRNRGRTAPRFCGTGRRRLAPVRQRQKQVTGNEKTGLLRRILAGELDSCSRLRS